METAAETFPTGFGTCGALESWSMHNGGWRCDYCGAWPVDITRHKCQGMVDAEKAADARAAAEEDQP